MENETIRSTTSRLLGTIGCFACCTIYGSFPAIVLFSIGLSLSLRKQGKDFIAKDFWLNLFGIAIALMIAINIIITIASLLSQY